MALTKAEMAERLFDEVGLDKREAKEFVDAFFDSLLQSLESGRQVKLSGFGNYELRRKNQGPGGTPKHGEDIPNPARNVEIGRAHGCTPVTNAQLVCRHVVEQNRHMKHIQG